MPISVTGSSRGRGFTLLELLVVLGISGLLLAVVLPSSARMYSAMREREAFRDARALLSAARIRALNSGLAQDVFVRPSERRLWSAQEEQRLPAELSFVVHGAAELNRDNTGVIRFYPEGGASGGAVDILRANGSGVRISVDWLLGQVTQEALPDS